MGKKESTPEAFAARPFTTRAAPFVRAEDAGDYWWCACGKSERQPFCDGSHRGGPTGPLVVRLEAPATVAWCGCKRTSTPPYCDRPDCCAEEATP
jgi:CDGSH-type Zn-finger protein